MLPLSVALPLTLKLPVITSPVESNTATFDVPPTLTLTLPPLDATATLEVPLLIVVVSIDVDAIVAGFLVTVVEVHREDGFGENLFRRANDRLEHALVGVFPGALGNLDDEGSLRLDAAAEEAHGLLGIVDVVSAYAVLAVGMLE